MSPASPEIGSPRLRMHRYRQDDFGPMSEMFDDAEVTRHTLLGRRDRAQCQQVLDGYMRFWDDNGYGMRALYERDSGEYAGECGLFIAPMGKIALRYALPRAHWGKGYATEASVAATADAFEVQGLDYVIAGVKPENLPSHHVLRKLGWRETELYHHGDLSFTIYEITRDEWRAQQATNQQG